LHGHEQLELVSGAIVSAGHHNLVRRDLPGSLDFNGMSARLAGEWTFPEDDLAGLCRRPVSGTVL
jgi:hypothetical protein